MARDSFFTGRNPFDNEIDHPAMMTVSCELQLEACARRMAKLEGPIGAYNRLQRVADICAGAYVLPPDMLGRVEAKPAPTVGFIIGVTLR